jgi:hypothetical protein
VAVSFPRNLNYTEGVKITVTDYRGLSAVWPRWDNDVKGVVRQYNPLPTCVPQSDTEYIPTDAPPSSSTHSSSSSSSSPIPTNTNTITDDNTSLNGASSLRDMAATFSIYSFLFMVLAVVILN